MVRPFDTFPVYLLTPIPAQMKAFANYLAKSREGRIEANISIVTLKGDLQTFYAAWRRLASKYIPADDRALVNDYVNSDDFLEMAQLTTAKLPKRPAHIADVKLIIDAMYKDTRIFKTNRQRISIIALLLLSMTSAERPGALVESSAYRNSNESLLWGDIDFIVVPDKDCPDRPTTVAKVTINYLKAGRQDDSKWKEFFVYMEPPENRDVCPVFALLSLAIEDGIFLDVSLIEEIMMPLHPPTAVHTLAMRPEKRRIPVFRAQVKMDGRWVTSPTEAMKYVYYNTTLKVFCRLEGFEGVVPFAFFTLCLITSKVDLRPYDLRRMAAGNYDDALKPEQRRLLMAHTPNSDMYHVSLDLCFRSESDPGFLPPATLPVQILPGRFARNYQWSRPK